jgi:hypothetical protein
VPRKPAARARQRDPQALEQALDAHPALHLLLARMHAKVD